MKTDYLSRSILIDCCKDGTITYRFRGQRPFNGVALPVFSVSTEEQAKAIQTMFCTLQVKRHPKNPGQPWYVWHLFGGRFEDLAGVTKTIAKWWKSRGER